jgi:putative ABC transport system permease protein
VSRALIRLAWRGLRNNRRFSLFFVLNLVLGLSGFLTLDAFKASVTASLAERSRQVLTADLAVSSRRAITDDELSIVRAALDPRAKEMQVLTMYSMVASSATSRLAELVVIPEPYPFYGAIKLRQGGLIEGASPKDVVTGSVLWMQPDLAAQLRAAPGDTLRIGEQHFRLGDLIEEDLAAGGRGFSLASRVIMGRSQLDSARLVQKGSTIFYQHLFQLPPGADAEGAAKELGRRLRAPDIRIVSHERASQTVGRLQGFLNDYLGLAALASLFLSALGAAYLFRSYFARRLKDIAILMSLGLNPGSARRVFLLQLSFLGAAGGLIAVLFSLLLLPVTIRFLAAFLAFPITPVLSPSSLAWAMAIGVFGSLLTCAPILVQLRGLRPSALFQEQEALSASGAGFRALMATIPALLLYWALAMWQAKSIRTGSLFVGLFLGAGLILGVIAGGALTGLTQATTRHRTKAASELRLWGRLALRHVARARVASLSCFLAIGLGVLLINLIPQIQKSLEEEVRQPRVSEVPSLFLFDIQPEQEEPLQTFIRARGASLNFITPLIRGRLEQVNGKRFEKNTEESRLNTREDESESRMRNRSFNLTYRDALTESEKIVAGRPFSPNVGEVAEISVEQRFAKRLHLRLGDVLQFDIQGVPIEGKIVNFRSVEWTSFQPNFFVQFQPGVLEDAPKTFLASVPRMPPEDRLRLQDAIVNEFPTISIIDVSQVVSRLLTIFGQMAWAIRWMALLSLISGFVVLFSIANHEAHLRRSEANLLKVLGAGFSRVRGLFRLEYALLTFAAGLFGTLISFGMSYALSRVLFDNTWQFAWQTPLVVTLATTALAVLTVDLATTRVLKTPALGLLKDDEG